MSFEQKTIDIGAVDDIIRRLGTSPKALIPILQAVQDRFKYLPEEALRHVCENTEITPSAIAGVSTFYTQFRHRPVGRHVIHVCTGTACHVKGAELVRDALYRSLHIEKGEDTDAGDLFTVQRVACLGCCTLAPVVQIDNITYGHVQSDSVERMLRDFLDHRESDTVARPEIARTPKGEPLGEIRVGLGSCCVASGSGGVKQALETELAKTRMNIAVKRVGCVGMCHQTPLVEVCLPDQESVLYARVQAGDVRGIVRNHFRPRRLTHRISEFFSSFLDDLFDDEDRLPISRHHIDVRDRPVESFLGRQKHIATEFCGVLDPVDLQEYRQREGFTALDRCLTEMSGETIIKAISASGLRGRGGAGFPTGTKWQYVRSAEDEKKYIICNGDEGDPGAFMDRMLLESYPYRIIEGMAIAALAVGANEGYLYIRAEYPLAVRRIREAIRRCETENLLGENILKSGFSLHLSIMEGAGAFVCGEETALLASIEGKRGMPRIRPPYPARKGLWNHPTLVNNVETYAVVPWIIRHGPEAFYALGTDKSKGTKVFALAGKVKRGGLIEVPMGITIDEIVNEIGGGIAEGRRFKAVQIGGPSGGCIPAELSSIGVDFEELLDAGAMMGSGGLLVMDESDCMVDIARYFLTFTQDQSCGKCTFCRIGTRRMLDILEKICSGEGKPDDLNVLAEFALKIKQGSMCGLGKTAPNPILTSLKYFRSEYEAHLEGRCPAKKCKSLITYTINEGCIGCTLCAQQCPVEAIEKRPYRVHEIDITKCIRCDTCRQICPSDAVEVH